MYALFTTLNDYDQPTYCAIIWSNKPTAEELLKKISEQYSYFDEDKVIKLLKGKTCYDTLSNKAEPCRYTSFSFSKISEGEWL